MPEVPWGVRARSRVGSVPPTVQKERVSLPDPPPTSRSWNQIIQVQGLFQKSIRGSSGPARLCPPWSLRRVPASAQARVSPRLSPTLRVVLPLEQV